MCRIGRSDGVRVRGVREVMGSVLVVSIVQSGMVDVAQAETLMPSLNNLVYSLFAGFTVLAVTGAIFLVTRRN